MIDMTSWIVTIMFCLVAVNRWWTPGSKVASAAYYGVALALAAFLMASFFFDVRLLVPIDPALRGANRLVMLIVMVIACVAIFAGVIRQIMRDEAARVAAFED